MKIFGFSVMTLILFGLFFFAGTKFPGTFSGWPILGKL